MAEVVRRNNVCSLGGIAVTHAPSAIQWKKLTTPEWQARLAEIEKKFPGNIVYRDTEYQWRSDSKNIVAIGKIVLKRELPIDALGEPTDNREHVWAESAIKMLYEIAGVPPADPHY